MSKERVSPIAMAIASIAMSIGTTEQVDAKGMYTARCVGPVEERRTEYNELRARIERAESAPWYKPWLYLDLAALRDRFLAIPLEEKWADAFPNLVTTVGKNNLLDNHLAGSAYTATWYMGLVDGGSTPTYAAGDTMSSHSGWTESTAYSQANRPTAAWSAASSGSKSLSAALTFSINATATIAGCFLASNSTKGGTTGVLYSCGNFTGGNKSVANGDTLNVSYTAQA